MRLRMSTVLARVPSLRHKPDLQPEDGGDLVERFHGRIAAAGFDLAQGCHADVAVLGELGLRQATGLAHAFDRIGNAESLLTKLEKQGLKLVVSLKGGNGLEAFIHALSSRREVAADHPLQARRCRSIAVLAQGWRGCMRQ